MEATTSKNDITGESNLQVIIIVRRAECYETMRRVTRHFVTLEKLNFENSCFLVTNPTVQSNFTLQMAQ